MPKARVLAVDDQRYFRELIEGLLTDEGYEVVTASSGEEALHVFEREDFDIIVTDLVMPGIDGAELVQRIKERRPEQAIVMVTGVVDVKTAVAAMKEGATDYILKPFDRKALSVSLEKILKRRRLHEEHSRLMAENLEYMGVLSLYERAASLFSTLSLEGYFCVPISLPSSRSDFKFRTERSTRFSSQELIGVVPLSEYCSNAFR